LLGCVLQRERNFDGDGQAFHRGRIPFAGPVRAIEIHELQTRRPAAGTLVVGYCAIKHPPHQAAATTIEPHRRQSVFGPQKVSDRFHIAGDIDHGGRIVWIDFGLKLIDSRQTADVDLQFRARAVQTHDIGRLLLAIDGGGFLRLRFHAAGRTGHRRRQAIASARVDATTAIAARPAGIALIAAVLVASLCLSGCAIGLIAVLIVPWSAAVLAARLSQPSGHAAQCSASRRLGRILRVGHHRFQTAQIRRHVLHGSPNVVGHVAKHRAGQLSLFDIRTLGVVHAEIQADRHHDQAHDDGTQTEREHQFEQRDATTIPSG
jgi:hypothetical protein